MEHASSDLRHFSIARSQGNEPVDAAHRSCGKPVRAGITPYEGLCCSGGVFMRSEKLTESYAILVFAYL